MCGQITYPKILTLVYHIWTKKIDKNKAKYYEVLKDDSPNKI